MKRTSGIVWSLGMAAAVLLVAGQARAVEPDGEGQIILNSEFMVMDSFGTDLNVFEIKIEDGPSGNSTNSGKDIEMDEDFGWRGDLQYKKGGWGAGISGFHFDNEGSESEFLRGDSLAGGGGQNEISLRTAGASFDCLESGFFRGHCIGKVDADLKAWMVDLYGIRELVRTPDVGVDLQFGLRLAEFDWDVDSFAAAVDDDLVTIVDDEPVGSSSSSDVDDTLVGPFLSILSTGRWGRIRVDGQLSQAVVFGELNQDSTRAQYEQAGTLSTLVLEEVAALSQNQDAVIPITDLRIKIGYDVLDWLTVGFGAFASTWFNVPEPPNVEAIDRTIGNSSISSDEENLTFLGASFSVEVRFGGGSMPDFGSWLP